MSTTLKEDLSVALDMLHDARSQLDLRSYPCRDCNRQIRYNFRHWQMAQVLDGMIKKLTRMVNAPEEGPTMEVYHGDDEEEEGETASG